MSPPTPSPIPERFLVARKTLLFDRFMNYFIKVGGIGVILAVFAIFVFILIEILPLFGKAKVEEEKTFELSKAQYVALAVDEWSELPVLVTAEGALYYYDISGRRPVRRLDPQFEANKRFTANRFSPRKQKITFGTEDGHFAIVDLRWKPTYPVRPEERVVEPDVTVSPFFPLGRKGHPILALDYGDSGQNKLAVAIQEIEGRKEVHAVQLTQRRALIGAARVEVGASFDLTPLIQGTPVEVAVPVTADAVIVATQEGDVLYLFLQGDEFRVRQVFQPFRGLPDDRVVMMDFVFGDVSLVFANASGDNRVFSLYRDAATNTRLFGHTKTFERLPGVAQRMAQSLRNKAFLVTGEDFASLRFSTTESIRWEAQLPFKVQAAALSGKYDRILILDTEGSLHFYALKDKHPEASFKAFFGKIWYEGQAAPGYDWQSTGGSDDFEPKLSLVPLIVGSLKGTFYAMFFAVPIALLAAIYTSQFLKPEIKRVVKPTMEIMASLPSVVLGFLAALWLAPIVDTRVPSVLLVILGIPLSAFLFGWLWMQLPVTIRLRLRPGYEVFVFTPVLLGVAWLCWEMGPVLERLIFVVSDPTTGHQIADFRLWWPQFTGSSYTSRNSLVVGFMMGFAVIPIIFTITEDALSNVPDSLRSGSLALGASRWQTAIRIVLPTAAAGIFSAMMIGLGRAVGETMIVVMATGNTPIMEMNIFSGMRTLSANIAVELPEAPHSSTLYRALFLGAMVLFLMTFAVNTLAEILRQYLRERYKTVD